MNNTSVLVGWVFTVILSSITGFGGALVYARYHPAPDPTRVVVMDIDAMLKPIAENAGLTPEQRSAAAKDVSTRVRELAEKYATRGYVVLDGAVVFKAPKELYVNAP